MTNRPLRVFLCHSSKDKSAVRELYKKLRAEIWIDPWLDEEKLLPGQDWHMEIEKAVEVTDVVVVLLSSQSVSQEGYIQRELKLALDVAEEKPEGTIFIAPLRLDDCPAPRRLRSWQYVDYFPADRKDWAVERLIASLETRAESLGLKFENPAIPKVSNPIEEKLPVFQLKPAPVIKSIYGNEFVFSNGMEFMRVPAGKFIMGNNNGEDDEKPQHKVDLPYDYWMGRYPVTNEQYNVYAKAKRTDHPVSNWQKKKDHPVVCISWDQAMEYCKWLNVLLKSELSSEMMIRLPTEAEWEKASCWLLSPRGGGVRREGESLEYPWGNTFDKTKCNSSKSGKDDTTSVGIYSPQGDSPYGCADMAGNVWEWTHSEIKAYPYNSKDGREDEERGVARVVRGGAYDLGSSYHRCAYRNWFDPDNRYCGIGFRMVVASLFS